MARRPLLETATPTRALTRVGEQARRRDALVALWTVAWLAIGGAIGYLVWQLGEVGDNVAQSGAAVQQVGDAVQQLGSIPVVGGVTGRLGREISTTGQSVVTQGHSNADRIRELGVLTGVVVALGPSLSVLWLYVPLRRAHAREVRSVRSALAIEPGDASAVLAQRAVLYVPHDVLSDNVPAPYNAFRSGQYGRLADAELARLGLKRVSPASGLRQSGETFDQNATGVERGEET
jgi:hypothetical protein